MTTKPKIDIAKVIADSRAEMKALRENGVPKLDITKEEAKELSAEFEKLITMAEELKKEAAAL